MKCAEITGELHLGDFRQPFKEFDRPHTQVVT